VFAGASKPKASQDTNETLRLPEIVLPVAVAEPVPETVQFAG
jgi:hypothetical protein